MYFLSCAAVAASALLTFLLEPMFAKMALPLLGGAANVWIAAMMFYQIALLIGYLYAHVLSHTSLRTQWLVHGALCAAALCSLPVAVPAGWTPPADVNPAPALLVMMALAIGAPFALLCATAPLTQNWFALARPGSDPFRLYAFSNAGSFAGLLAYPLAVEPFLTLPAQSHAWSAGYVAVALLMFTLGYRSLASAPAERLKMRAPARPVAAGTLLRWIALAAIPSSLLLSFTSFLTVDVGSLPLLWVVPLALYLTTFILAFSARSEFFSRVTRTYYPLLAIASGIALVPVFAKTAPTSAPTMLTYLAAYVMAALGCHAELAHRRPASENLTLFYLAISFGGALGGVFNSLIAPLIFNDIVEFPLGLILAAWLIGGASRERNHWLAAGAACACIAIAIVWPDGGADEVVGAIVFRICLASALLLLFLARRNAAALCGGLSVCLALSLALPGTGRLVLAERNFYGVNRVRDMDGQALRRMEHGDTIHGLAGLQAEERLIPLGYYNPSGGLAETTLLVNKGKPAPKIALIGLGAGEMACIGEKGWSYDLYEIDPGVIRIASNPHLFPFLSDCPTSHRVIQGDGRLNLRAAQAESYDQIILDAFTSDSIPVHLLTREALAEYASKLKPGGVLTLHLSNRYFSLAPVVAAEAQELGLSGAVHISPGRTIGPNKLPVMATLVVNLASDATALAPLRNHGWSRLRPVAGMAGWTDDWSNVLSALILPGHEIQTGEELAERSDIRRE